MENGVRKKRNGLPDPFHVYFVSSKCALSFVYILCASLHSSMENNPDMEDLQQHLINIWKFFKLLDFFIYLFLHILPFSLPYYDPFNPLSVKLLMLDHLNHYIYYPLCWWMDTYFFHISDRLLFITPDMISLSHVFLAAIGARCLLSESLSQRRCGVIFFQIRTMLDSYDGMVARARANTIGKTRGNRFQKRPDPVQY